MRPKKHKTTGVERLRVVKCGSREGGGQSIETCGDEVSGVWRITRRNISLNSTTIRHRVAVRGARAACDRDRRHARHARGQEGDIDDACGDGRGRRSGRQRHRAGPGAARRQHHWAVILAQCSTGTIVFCGRCHLRAAEEESKCLMTI